MTQFLLGSLDLANAWELLTPLDWVGKTCSCFRKSPQSTMSPKLFLGRLEWKKTMRSKASWARFPPKGFRKEGWELQSSTRRKRENLIDRQLRNVEPTKKDMWRNWNRRLRAWRKKTQSLNENCLFLKRIRLCKKWCKKTRSILIWWEGMWTMRHWSPWLKSTISCRMTRERRHL